MLPRNAAPALLRQVHGCVCDQGTEVEHVEPLYQVRLGIASTMAFQ